MKKNITYIDIQYPRGPTRDTGIQHEATPESTLKRESKIIHLKSNTVSVATAMATQHPERDNPEGKQDESTATAASGSEKEQTLTGTKLTLLRSLFHTLESLYDEDTAPQAAKIDTPQITRPGNADISTAATPASHQVAHDDTDEDASHTRALAVCTPTSTSSPQQCEEPEVSVTSTDIDTVANSASHQVSHDDTDEDASHTRTLAVCIPTSTSSPQQREEPEVSVTSAETSTAANSTSYQSSRDETEDGVPHAPLWVKCNTSPNTKIKPVSVADASGQKKSGTLQKCTKPNSEPGLADEADTLTRSPLLGTPPTVNATETQRQQTLPRQRQVALWICWWRAGIEATKGAFVQWHKHFVTFNGAATTRRSKTASPEEEASDKKTSESTAGRSSREIAKMQKQQAQNDKRQLRQRQKRQRQRAAKTSARGQQHGNEAYEATEASGARDVQTEESTAPDTMEMESTAEATALANATTSPPNTDNSTPPTHVSTTDDYSGLYHTGTDTGILEVGVPSMHVAEERKAHGRLPARSIQRDVVGGFRLFQEAIPEALAAELVGVIENQVRAGREGKLLGHTYLECSNIHATAGKYGRTQLQYGSKPFNYINVSPDFDHVCEGTPEVLQRLMAHLVDNEILEPMRMHTFIINIYEAGSWVPPHTDHNSYGPVVVGISLGDTASIVLGAPSDLSANGDIYDQSTGIVSQKAIIDGRVASIPLPHRSAYVMQGTSRTWSKHTLRSEGKIRYSITIRPEKQTVVDAQRQLRHFVGQELPGSRAAHNRTVPYAGRLGTQGKLDTQWLESVTRGAVSPKMTHDRMPQRPAHVRSRVTQPWRYVRRSKGPTAVHTATTTAPEAEGNHFSVLQNLEEMTAATAAATEAQAAAEAEQTAADGCEDDEEAMQMIAALAASEAQEEDATVATPANEVQMVTVASTPTAETQAAAEAEQTAADGCEDDEEAMQMVAALAASEAQEEEATVATPANEAQMVTVASTPTTAASESADQPAADSFDGD